MKTIFTIGALALCSISIFGQRAASDTIYVYETVTIYDTIVVRDTIRVKRTADVPITQVKNIKNAREIHVASSKNNNLIFFAPSTATFSKNSVILHENNKQKNSKTMKLNFTKFLSAAILTAQSMSGILAQEPKPENELKMFPAQMSFVYPMTTQGAQTVNYRYLFSFNMFAGKVGAVQGVELGGFFNKVEGDMTGIQLGGLINSAKTVTGAQFGGLINISENVTTGIQFGGLANITKSVKGAQLGGLININTEITGVQFGGIANIGENIKGTQFGGIVNLTEKIEGQQFGGIANIGKEVSGVSFAGLFNRTETLRGVQFAGIVNVIDTIEKGASIALVSIVKKGAYKEWSLTFADYQNVGLSYKMGTQKFYTIFTAGGNFMEDNLWAFGVGFGNRTSLGGRFDFQPEIVSYQYFPTNFKHNTSVNHLKLGFVCNLNDRLGIVVAPSVYHFYAEANKNNAYDKVSPFSPFYKNENKNRLHSIGAGISVGLAFRNK